MEEGRRKADCCSVASKSGSSLTAEVSKSRLKLQLLPGQLGNICEPETRNSAEEQRSILRVTLQGTPTPVGQDVRDEVLRIAG